MAGSVAAGSRAVRRPLFLLLVMFTLSFCSFVIISVIDWLGIEPTAVFPRAARRADHFDETERIFYLHNAASIVYAAWMILFALRGAVKGNVYRIFIAWIIHLFLLVRTLGVLVDFAHLDISFHVAYPWAAGFVLNAIAFVVEGVCLGRFYHDLKHRMSIFVLHKQLKPAYLTYRHFGELQLLDLALGTALVPQWALFLQPTLAVEVPLIAVCLALSGAFCILVSRVGARRESVAFMAVYIFVLIFFQAYVFERTVRPWIDPVAWVVALDPTVTFSQNGELYVQVVISLSAAVFLVTRTLLVAGAVVVCGGFGAGLKEEVFAMKAHLRVTLRDVDRHRSALYGVG